MASRECVWWADKTPAPRFRTTSNTCTKGQLVVRRGQLGGEGGQKSEDQEPASRIWASTRLTNLWPAARGEGLFSAKAYNQGPGHDLYRPKIQGLWRSGQGASGCVLRQLIWPRLGWAFPKIILKIAPVLTRSGSEIVDVIRHINGRAPSIRGKET